MARRLAVFLLATALSLPVAAATRMTYDIQGVATAIEWAPAAFPLPYEIDPKVALVHPNAVAMVGRAFDAWAEIDGANIRFQSNGVLSTAVQASERIAVTVGDDLFLNQGAVAVTAYKYDTTTGRMTDADIVIDPSLFNGSMNAQMALQHEVGHVLGLDHSAVLSSIMYPFVGKGENSSSFGVDDRIAISSIYPKGDPTLTGATLTGRLLGDGGGIFAAQVVAVNDRGEPVGTTLTNASGEFSLPGIPAGRYRLYAEPLDGPVDPAALQGSWRQAKATPFPTEFFDAPIVVENGRVYGNLVLTTAGAVRLNPRWIGVSAAGRNDVSLSTSPVTVSPGTTFTITVAGDGFTSGMTEFEVMNPAFRRVSDFTWSDNYVRASFAVDPAASVGSAVLMVRTGNETAMLTGAMRVHRTPRGRAVGK
ncbi:MAG TPA: matrixin family metalloprotease [Thermoanaerobaculia bacterium]|nr:matrixin family metalloprotease [Thermoanaerobaculia bacterium]